jgi:hypothetical protein
VRLDVRSRALKPDKIRITSGVSIGLVMAGVVSPRVGRAINKWGGRLTLALSAVLLPWRRCYRRPHRADRVRDCHRPGRRRFRRQATSTIPIVMAISGDAVATGRHSPQPLRRLFRLMSWMSVIPALVPHRQSVDDVAVGLPLGHELIHQSHKARVVR